MDFRVMFSADKFSAFNMFLSLPGRSREKKKLSNRIFPIAPNFF